MLQSLGSQRVGYDRATELNLHKMKQDAKKAAEVGSLGQRLHRTGA